MNNENFAGILASKVGLIEQLVSLSDRHSQGKQRVRKTGLQIKVDEIKKSIDVLCKTMHAASAIKLNLVYRLSNISKSAITSTEFCDTTYNFI